MAASTDSMASVAFRADAPAGRTDRLGLAEAKHERDDHPYADERAEHPEQEGRFADGKPGKLRALEEELSPAERDPTWPTLDHLGADCSSRVVSDPPLRVAQDPRTPSVPRWPAIVLRHRGSLDLLHAGQHRRERTVR
jgi:hypothetical protein